MPDDRPPLESFLQRPPLESFAKTEGVATAGKIPQKQMGATERFMTGMQDPLVGGKQLIAHIAKSPEDAQKIDTQVKAREQQIQEAGGGGIMRGIGGMVGAAPAMAAGPLGPVLGGAIGGATSAAVQPITGTGDYWTQKTDDVLYGTAFGVGAGTAASVLGGIIGGPSSEAAKALMKSGVNLTPGQMTGGVVRRAEEAFKSLPILGSFIRGAEGRGIEGFNRGVANQVLEPIGQKIDPNLTGRALIAKTEEALGNAYDKVLPHIKMRIDPDLAGDLGDIRNLAKELPNTQRDQFENILNNRVASYFRQSPLGNQGAMLKQTMGELRSLANQYRSGPPETRQLAYRLDDVNSALRKGMIRQNPELSDDLRKVDSAWAMFTRMQDASVRRATSEGTFTPSDLLQTIKSQDKSVRHGRFARGDELLQVYAQYGQKILPGKLPDSGTTERALYDAALLAASGGAAMGHLPLAPAAGLLAGSVPYTGPGMAVINKIGSAGPARQAAGSMVRKAAPYAGIGAVPYGSQQDDKPEYGGPQQ